MSTPLKNRPTSAPTAERLISQYAADIAFVSEEAPATTLDGFISQLSIAADRMEDAGINGAEDLATAATYLSDAANASDTDRTALLNQASKLLKPAHDMADEYRDMV